MKSGFLVFNPENGRIGILRGEEWLCDGLQTGQSVELFLHGEWKATRLESDMSGNWYFVGFPDVGINTEARLREENRA